MKTRSFLAFFLACGCSGQAFGTGGGAGDTAPPSSGLDGAMATGGRPTGAGGLPTGSGGAGGARATGGVGGAHPASGGAPATGGTVTATGGTSSTGGAVTDAACVLVTHGNGIGQTWQDCVPLGTYDLNQAMKACEAFTTASCPSARCTLPIGACSSGNNSSEYTGDCGDGHILWTYAVGYQSSGVGHVANTLCPTSQDPSWG